MRYFLLVVSFVLALVAFSIDLSSKDIALLGKGIPEFEGVYLLRTALVMLSSCLFVIALVKPQVSSKLGVILHSKPRTWADWGVLTLSIDNSLKRKQFLLTLKEGVTWIVLLIALSFLFVFLYDPIIFNWLALEDRPVEIFSALLCFITCAVFLLTSMTLRLNNSHSNLFYVVATLALACIFFLIGMEEISWFQRIFSIPTPQGFQGNSQNELNLHNFQTSKFEVCYYFSAFIFFIMLPFVDDKTSIFQIKQVTAFFTPSKFILFVSAISAAYNYNMWNIIFTQISFFMTLFILMYYTWQTHSNNQSFLVPTFSLSLNLVIVYGLTQTLFLIYGNSFLRNWDVTEYKEFLIPLSFLVYSLEILHKAKELKLAHTKELI